MKLSLLEFGVGYLPGARLQVDQFLLGLNRNYGLRVERLESGGTGLPVSA